MINEEIVHSLIVVSVRFNYDLLHYFISAYLMFWPLDVSFNLLI
jgi:hypothetical protein